MDLTGIKTRELQEICRTQYSEQWNSYPRDRRYRQTVTTFLVKVGHFNRLAMRNIRSDREKEGYNELNKSLKASLRDVRLILEQCLDKQEDADKHIKQLQETNQMLQDIINAYSEKEDNEGNPHKTKNNNKEITMRDIRNSTTGHKYIEEGNVHERTSGRHHIRVSEEGGGGDCLFHSIRKGLEELYKINKKYLEDKHQRRRFIKKYWVGLLPKYTQQRMQFVRNILGDAIRRLPNDSFISTYVVGTLRKVKANMWNEKWHPRDIFKRAKKKGFKTSVLSKLGKLMHHTMIDVYQEVRHILITLWFEDDTQNRQLKISNSLAKFLKDEWAKEYTKPGMNHWGDDTDIKLLCKSLNIGIIVFQENKLHPYGYDEQNFNFPYYIFVTNVNNIHFQSAALVDYILEKYDYVLPRNQLTKEFISYFNLLSLAKIS